MGPLPMHVTRVVVPRAVERAPKEDIVAMISDPTAMLAAPTSTGSLAPRRLGKHINSLAEVVVAPPLPMHVTRVVVPPAVERAPKEDVVAMISDPTAMLAARTS